MLMTMDNFLKNPVGPGSASVARRDVIIRNLQERYRKLRLANHSGFKVQIFLRSSDGVYFFKFKIPSEEFPTKLSYDVVLKFTPPADKTRLISLNQYTLTVFSNSLNFNFTYTYIYNLFNILIPELKVKYSEIAIKNPPIIKNPNQDMGFEKSVYYALLFMKELKFNFFNNFRTIPFNKSALLQVSSAQEKINEYNRVKQVIRDSKKTNKKSNKNTPPKKSFSTVNKTEEEAKTGFNIFNSYFNKIKSSSKSKTF